MRRILPVLFFLVCGIQQYARPVQHTKHSREQTNFGAEDAFQKPLSIPLEALQTLGTDDVVQECAKQEGIPAAEIPASWFVASEIQLTGKPSSGMVVRGENICLLGAHIAQFWVLSKSPQGYRVIFHGRADGLSVLPTRTNGYRDLELVIVTEAGANVDLVRLRYSEGQYHVSGHRVEHN